MVLAESLEQILESPRRVQDAVGTTVDDHDRRTTDAAQGVPDG
jgi:hypothetical protein